ncbi:arsenite methyltransferase [Elusimicrobiota bacterium]
MDKNKQEEIKQKVRENYGKIAQNSTSCCGPSGQSGCSCGTQPLSADKMSKRLGYSDEDIDNVPKGSNLGLGCGNPSAIASLKKGEIVLDLGSGAGFDCFLAAKQVGDKGRVIGVDMTHEMLSKARTNAEKNNYKNVEFRLGEIEHLPVADNSVDIVISNCVVNLSPDKPAVYSEVFRVLKPKGRIAISDVVITAEIPDKIKKDLELWSACATGAETVSGLEKILKKAGFKNISIQPVNTSREFIKEWMPGSKIEDFVMSANIAAIKP